MFSDLDLTELETYLIERQSYADEFRETCAQIALDDLLDDIIIEAQRRAEWWDSVYTHTNEEVVQRYIYKMRKLREHAPVGQKLKYTVAIKEAEGLKAIFIKERTGNENHQLENGKCRIERYKGVSFKELSEDPGRTRDRVRDRISTICSERHRPSSGNRRGAKGSLGEGRAREDGNREGRLERVCSDGCPWCRLGTVRNWKCPCLDAEACSDGGSVCNSR